MKKYFWFFFLLYFNIIFAMEHKSFYPSFVEGKKVYGVVKHEDDSFSLHTACMSGIRDVRKKLKSQKISFLQGRVFYVACKKDDCLLGLVKDKGNIRVFIYTKADGLKVFAIAQGKRFFIKNHIVDFEVAKSLSVCQRITLLGGFTIFSLFVIFFLHIIK